MQKRYKGLRIISGIYRFIGVFVGGVSIIGGVVTSVLSGNYENLLLMVPGAISGLALYGFGELFVLLMDMEENGRRQALLLERLMKRKEQ